MLVKSVAWLKKQNLLPPSLWSFCTLHIFCSIVCSNSRKLFFKWWNMTNPFLGADFPMWIVQTKIPCWIFCDLFSIVCSKLATQWQTHTKRRHGNYLHISIKFTIFFFLFKLWCVLMDSVTVQPKKTVLCALHEDTIPASLFPPGGRSWFVYEGRSRSLVPRFTACPEQMGDSGNWHEGLLACWDSSLSPKMPHLHLSSRWMLLSIH